MPIMTNLNFIKKLRGTLIVRDEAIEGQRIFQRY